jgi:transcriptional regulator with XRE-family HTH domain
MYLAKRIKEKRLESKLTQEKLGNLLHVSKVSVCNWENGIKRPSSKNLIQLSKVLNTPLEYLIGNDHYVISSEDEK